MHRPSAKLLFISPLILAAFAASAAEQTAPDPSQLKSVEQNLEKTEAERIRLQQEAEALAREVTTLRTNLIAAAKDIQDQEYSLMVLENRIRELEGEAARLTATLGRRDEQMVRVLSALERLALRPSDALALFPLTPDNAVRSAILLRAAVPGIQHSAGKLQTELVDLYRVRTEIITQRERVALGAASLIDKHKKLENLSARKTEQQVAVAERTHETTQRVQKLAQEAADLRELFAKLAEEKTRRDAEEKRIAEAKAKEERERASSDGLLPAAPTTGRIVLKPPPGVAPIAPPTPDASSGKSFAEARGSMPYPVIGSLTSKYGEAADEGVMSKGIIITSRPESPVVAPFDGVVAFAGPFRGYGLLLIIEHSEGYHTLLAGMGRIDSSVGQRVLAGEPVGVMDSGEATSLYLELRRDGQPINPLPWLAARTGTSSG